MLFSQLAVFLKELEVTNSRLVMTEKLSQLFSEATSEEIDKAIYLLQGSVVPQYEKLDFGLAERLVFKAMVSSFSLDSKIAKEQFKKSGDLGLTAQHFRKGSNSLFAPSESLNLLTVFEKLTVLAQQTGTGSQETKLSILADLLQQLDPLSCRYLVRIVLSRLRLGFSEMTILDALSWYLKGDKSLRAEIERAYNVRPDLGLIAKLIKAKGLESLKSIQPEPGIPILMARAERVSNPEQIIKKIGQSAIEPKYDGFRLQLHKLSNGEVRIFSRNLENVVAMFPDLVKAVKTEIKAKSCIFEAEAVGYDPLSKQILPFQEIVQRKRKYQIEEKAKEIPLRLFAFDLLFLNNNSLLNHNYQDRRQQLSLILANKPKATIELAQETIANTENEINALFHKAVKQGLEGIMAKKLTGIYQAGARDWNWIKYKHSYASKLIDTIDCLVMGFDYGKGKRTGFGIGAFLVGVLDEQKDQFVTVAKIGTGLTDEEWRYLKTQSQSLITNRQPKNFQVAKNNSCDVWLEPALVVEIRSDELTQSPAHSAGLALRFPRLEHFRPDKKPNQVTTLVELKKIYHLQHKSSISS